MEKTGENGEKWRKMEKNKIYKYNYILQIIYIW